MILDTLPLENIMIRNGIPHGMHINFFNLQKDIIMTKLKSAKQVREGNHIYGQLPDGLTPSEVKSLMIVLLSIAVFAAVMVFGSVFIGE